MKPRGRPLVIVLLSALVAAACASADRKVVRIPLDDGAPATLAVAGSGVDDVAMLRTVAAAVKRLGLPLSSPLNAYFYADARAFELGLVSEGRTETWFAKDQASFAVAVGGYWGIRLRADKLAAMTLANRVGVIAHELTHVAQAELGAGQRGVSEQWLREGFADWVKHRVVDDLGLHSYAVARSVLLGRLLKSTDALPGLTSLSTNRDWTSARQRWGSLATYGQSFLAAEWLVERFGLEAVIAYFRRAAIANDRDVPFRASFGLGVEEFADEFSARMTALRPPS